MDLLGFRRSTFGSETSSTSATLKKRSFESKKGLCPDHPLAYCTIVNADLASYICYKCRVSPIRSSSSQAKVFSPPAKRFTPPKDSSSHLVPRAHSDAKILYNLHKLSLENSPGSTEGLSDGANMKQKTPVAEDVKLDEWLSPSPEPEASFPSDDREESAAVEPLPRNAPRTPSLRLMRITASLDERFENVADTKIEISKKIAADIASGEALKDARDQVATDISLVDGFYIVDRNFTYDDYLRLVVKKKI